jgi:DNA (cytosine-5)-methyltransferase 1
MGMRVLGLFSGIGGFELGLQTAGFEITGMCEIEAHCRRVLEKNFSCDISDDIRNLMPTEGSVDLICGGFPCQDISIAGKNKGLLGGEKSSLWREYLRVINQGKPKYAIIENVSAILGRGLEIILQDLAEIGYDATYTTYDTKYFGLPQRRRRVYILAVRDGITIGSDVFNTRGRDTVEHRSKVAAVNEGFEWDFTESRRVANPFAFFTRQRSDQFSETGLSGTLAKRDYKSFTDLVVQGGYIRRVTPKERLALQGFPLDWMDDCDLTHSQMFSCNGMSVPVVAHIGCLINEYDRSL